MTRYMHVGVEKIVFESCLVCADAYGCHKIPKTIKPYLICTSFYSLYKHSTQLYSQRSSETERVSLKCYDIQTVASIR